MSSSLTQQCEQLCQKQGIEYDVSLLNRLTADQLSHTLQLLHSYPDAPVLFEKKGVALSFSYFNRSVHHLYLQTQNSQAQTVLLNERGYILATEEGKPILWHRMPSDSPYLAPHWRYSQNNFNHWTVNSFLMQTRHMTLPINDRIYLICALYEQEPKDDYMMDLCPLDEAHCTHHLQQKHGANWQSTLDPQQILKTLLQYISDRQQKWLQACQPNSPWFNAFQTISPPYQQGQEELYLNNMEKLYGTRLRQELYKMAKLHAPS